MLTFPGGGERDEWRVKVALCPGGVWVRVALKVSPATDDHALRVAYRELQHLQLISHPTDGGINWSVGSIGTEDEVSGTKSRIGSFAIQLWKGWGGGAWTPGSVGIKAEAEGKKTANRL